MRRRRVWQADLMPITVRFDDGPLAGQFRVLEGEPQTVSYPQMDPHVEAAGAFDAETGEWYYTEMPSAITYRQIRYSIYRVPVPHLTQAFQNGYTHIGTVA